MSEKGKVGWGISRLVLLLQTSSLSYSSQQGLVSFRLNLQPLPLYFCFVLFLKVKCITEKSEVSEYWAFMTPRTFAFKQPEPRQTEVSHIYY